jgi:hypothetical protein
MPPARVLSLPATWTGCDWGGTRCPGRTGRCFWAGAAGADLVATGFPPRVAGAGACRLPFADAFAAAGLPAGCSSLELARVTHFLQPAHLPTSCPFLLVVNSGTTWSHSGHFGCSMVLHPARLVCTCPAEMYVCCLLFARRARSPGVEGVKRVRPRAVSFACSPIPIRGQLLPAGEAR